MLQKYNYIDGIINLSNLEEREYEFIFRKNTLLVI